MAGWDRGAPSQVVQNSLQSRLDAKDAPKPLGLCWLSFDMLLGLLITSQSEPPSPPKKIGRRMQKKGQFVSKKCVFLRNLHLLGVFSFFCPNSGGFANVAKPTCPPGVIAPSAPSHLDRSAPEQCSACGSCLVRLCRSVIVD